MKVHINYKVFNKSRVFAMLPRSFAKELCNHPDFLQYAESLFDEFLVTLENRLYTTITDDNGASFVECLRELNMLEDESPAVFIELDAIKEVGVNWLFVYWACKSRESLTYVFHKIDKVANAKLYEDPIFYSRPRLRLVKGARGPEFRYDPGVPATSENLVRLGLTTPMK